jgi:cytidylate kinase
MTVITLSRQLGSQGQEIAALVAQELGLRLVDAETINQAAKSAGVPQVALAEMEHQGKSGLANQVLKALRAMPSTVPLSSSASGETRTGRSDGLTFPFTGLFSPLVPPISASLDGYVHMVGLVIRGLAREGNVLIAGRGGQILLKDHPHALHVQIVAPLAFRTELIMERFSVDKKAAQNRLRASDRSRFDYLRRYHDADWLNPSLYHLVLNGGRASLEQATDLIITAQRTLAP